MKNETWICDLENCENEPENKGFKIQAIFLTEQTEGRWTAPYLYNETIDICNNCLGRVLKGNYIFAAGAMGYNKYFFKKGK